ncbi:MAG: glycosyltransferase family 1 protein [Patescibacteria group bacterium]
MIIGIDARMLGSENGGIGRYVEQLIAHLGAVEQTNRYVIFLKKSHWDAVRETDRVKKVLADISWYSWQEQWKFSRIIAKERIDLMHFPHWNVPLLYRKPFVVTVHDLIMFHYPRAEATTHGPVAYWVKDRVHRMVVKYAVRRAKKIITTSEFTKRDIHETLGVPLEKMAVTYQAPFQIPNSKFQIPNSVSVLETHGIRKPYVLYVGTAYPHKNIRGLLNAWKIFKEKYQTDHQLVLAGRESFFYDQLRPIVSKDSSVVFTGFVPDETLEAIYRQAELFVFPSLYEGFGLPPLEAMARGVPVVSSNRSCLPEVLGEAAVYADPENYEQMADAIYAGLTNENLRFTMRQNAKQELLRYSWDRLAVETLNVYRFAASS